MPEPNEGESREHFLGRCVPAVLEDGAADDRDQAVAMCNSIWEESKMPNDNRLLKAVGERKQKLTEFGYGILTADYYVRNMQDSIGTELCYRHGSSGLASFNDVLEKASRTLTYSNPETEVEEVYGDAKAKKIKLPGDAELPKNTLMVFRHTLTSSRKDRDGDTLHSDGAEVDPGMLLLFQHVHTMPIGKYLGTHRQNTKKLSVVSAIVDVNEISHDSAVMVDNGMGRFSHGFRALEFSEHKAEDGEELGFDVRKFEIMEESLVSVPANVDAGMEEVLLELVESKKLKSPVMREYGKLARERRPLRMPVLLDLKLTVNDREIKDANESGTGGEASGEGGDAGPSKEADADAAKEKEAEDKKVIERRKKILDEINWEGSEQAVRSRILDKYQEYTEQDADVISEKGGRTLSKANEAKIRDAKEDVDEVAKMDGVPRVGKATLRQAGKGLGEVLGSLSGEESLAPRSVSVEEAMSVVLACGTRSQRDRMLSMLTVAESVEKGHEKTKQYRSLVGTEE